MIVRAAVVLEAVMYVIGGLLRLIVFTFLDACESVARWFR